MPHPKLGEWQSCACGYVGTKVHVGSHRHHNKNVAECQGSEPETLTEREAILRIRRDGKTSAANLRRYGRDLSAGMDEIERVPHFMPEMTAADIVNPFADGAAVPDAPDADEDAPVSTSATLLGWQPGKSGKASLPKESASEVRVQIPQPSTATINVNIPVETMVKWDFCRRYFGYDQPFDVFLVECADFTLISKGWKLAFVPAEWQEDRPA